jgi:hypothetical protein
MAHTIIQNISAELGIPMTHDQELDKLGLSTA